MDISKLSRKERNDLHDDVLAVVLELESEGKQATEEFMKFLCMLGELQEQIGK